MNDPPPPRTTYALVLHAGTRVAGFLIAPFGHVNDVYFDGIRHLPTRTVATDLWILDEVFPCPGSAQRRCDEISAEERRR